VQDVIERSNLAGCIPTVAEAYFLQNVLILIPQDSGRNPDFWNPGKGRVGSKKRINMSENRDEVQVHGCIVCAKLFNLLAVYTPGGKLVDCTVTSPGGHIVPDENQPLVSCDTHTVDEIDNAYKRWLYNREQDSSNEQEDD
jgi:hypothetical protein